MRFDGIDFAALHSRMIGQDPVVPKPYTKEKMNWSLGVDVICDDCGRRGVGDYDNVRKTQKCRSCRTFSRLYKTGRLDKNGKPLFSHGEPHRDRMGLGTIMLIQEDKTPILWSREFRDTFTGIDVRDPIKQKDLVRRLVFDPPTKPFAVVIFAKRFTPADFHVNADASMIRFSNAPVSLGRDADGNDLSTDTIYADFARDLLERYPCDAQTWRAILWALHAAKTGDEVPNGVQKLFKAVFDLTETNAAIRAATDLCPGIDALGLPHPDDPAARSITFCAPEKETKPTAEAKGAQKIATVEKEMCLV